MESRKFDIHDFWWVVMLLVMVLGFVGAIVEKDAIPEEITEAPDGTYVSGRPQEAPDGTWVGGKPVEAPDGKWVGTKESDSDPFATISN